jgi:PAS domain S-box-containing protein
MSDAHSDMQALTEAFELFTRSTQTMEESYRRLEERIRDLDQELAAKNRELAVTSEYLNYILESITDGVIAVDTSGVLTAFNQAAGQTLGYEPDEVLGRPFKTVFGREFACAGKRPFTELRASDGTTVRVSERDAPIADRSRRRIGAVKVFQDLTEIETLREHVRHMDRLAAVGEMAATVAHEIRNPLGGISGFAALLARDIPPDDPRSRLVQKILTGARDLDRVVTELLEFTRPVQLRLEPIAAKDLVQSAVAFLDLDDRPIELTQSVEPDVTVVVDPDKMRRMLLNLLLNAAQSISGEGTIHISARLCDDHAEIAVADTGCGMVPEELQKVFDPFYTTKEKGTGLGLAVAAKIAEAHGGVLEAESSLGKGSTFRVRLPREERSDGKGRA